MNSKLPLHSIRTHFLPAQFRSVIVDVVEVVLKAMDMSKSQ